MDVVSASSKDNKIAWYENDGNGNFGSQQTITLSAIEAYSVYSTDLDGDGDMDVLSASSEDDKIAWYENDGNGNFGSQQIITLSADGANSVRGTDLDGDGDMDVLSASYIDDNIAWYENDGSGNFGNQQIISINTIGAQSIYSTDIDGDGDMDVLSASESDDKIAWYENLSITNIIEKEQATIKLFPNPMTETSYLFFEENCKDCKVRLTASNGQLVREYDSITGNKLTIERKGLAYGTYILQVVSGEERLKEFVLLIE